MQHRNLVREWTLRVRFLASAVQLSKKRTLRVHLSRSRPRENWTLRTPLSGCSSIWAEYGHGAYILGSLRSKTASGNGRRAWTLRVQTSGPSEYTTRTLRVQPTDPPRISTGPSAYSLIGSKRYKSYIRPKEEQQESIPLEKQNPLE